MNLGAVWSENILGRLFYGLDAWELRQRDLSLSSNPDARKTHARAVTVRQTQKVTGNPGEAEIPLPLPSCPAKILIHKKPFLLV